MLEYNKICHSGLDPESRLQKLGDYSHTSFSFKGKGRFKPEKGAEFETTSEERIEVIAPIKKYLEIVKKAHPYEEPAT